MAVPACFTAQHHGVPIAMTLECVNGNPLVNVYTFMAGVEASCPIGTGAMLQGTMQHMSGQCIMDSYGHHEHDNVEHHDDDHGDHHDDDHHDDHGDQHGGGEDMMDMVTHAVAVLV